jgi:tRNA(fMet)-specific endonuclease VapC
MTRRYMLDTDTVSYALRGVGDVEAKLLARTPSEVCISAITLGELRYGANRRKSKKLHGMIDVFSSLVAVMPFDENAAAVFGATAAELSVAGTPIGQLDTMIAAHAMALDLTLVTNNTKHFGLVPRLRIESWN